MKPRTKAQIEVFNLSQLVLDMHDKIKDWAEKECNDHLGLATKKHFWCIDCGDEHPIELVKNNKVTCPSCGSKLSIEKSLKRKHHQFYNVAFAEILGDYQVIRIFEVSTRHRKFEKSEVMVSENIQQFIPSDHSKIQYVARACNMGGNELRYGNLEIRKPHLWRERVYNPLQYQFHPKSFFKAEYTKIGIDQNLQGLTFLDAYQALSHSQAETLLKAKQYSLLNYFGYQSKSNIFNYWPSIKIAIRNNYIVDDASTWLDYLDLLGHFNKDLRSPKYLCPKDLKKQHDKLVEKRRSAQRKIKLEKQKLTIKRDQEKYEIDKGIFFGLSFSQGDISVKILETVQEFIEEGDTHHHCVYSNSYYSKIDSLVLSASYKGVKVETVQISLKSLQITQSRGFENKASKHNRKIIALVESNMYQIENRLFKMQETA